MFWFLFVSVDRRCLSLIESDWSKKKVFLRCLLSYPNLSQFAIVIIPKPCKEWTSVGSGNVARCHDVILKDHRFNTITLGKNNFTKVVTYLDRFFRPENDDWPIFWINYLAGFERKIYKYIHDYCSFYDRRINICPLECKFYPRKNIYAKRRTNVGINPEAPNWNVYILCRVI